MPGNISMLALAETAAEQLQGTCKALYELGNEFEDASTNKEFCERLDELVFECEVCNWWCEISEMSSKDMICDECEDE